MHGALGYECLNAQEHADRVEAPGSLDPPGLLLFWPHWGDDWPIWANARVHSPVIIRGE
jgi:hypothetical protein